RRGAERLRRPVRPREPLGSLRRPPRSRRGGACAVSHEVAKLAKKSLRELSAPRVIRTPDLLIRSRLATLGTFRGSTSGSLCSLPYFPRIRCFTGFRHASCCQRRSGAPVEPRRSPGTPRGADHADRGLDDA